MSEIKTKAIVLGGVDYKEKDKIINLFTLEYGILPVLFKGVKSSNAKLKSAKEIFSFGDFIINNGKTNIVTSAEVITQFYDITKNIKNYYCACNIIKIIKKVLPDGEVNSQLFVDTLKAFRLLNENKYDSLLILNKFLIEIFEGLGYKFNLNECSSCLESFSQKRYINLLYGNITCNSCKMGDVQEISNAEYTILRLIGSTDYDKLNSIKISKELLNSVYKILVKNLYYRFNCVLDELN